MAYVVERALSGWKASHEAATDDPEDLGFEPLSASETIEVDADCRKQAWARLLTKVYDGYAPRSIRLSAQCGSEMKVIAVIQDAWPSSTRSVRPGWSISEGAVRRSRRPAFATGI